MVFCLAKISTAEERKRILRTSYTFTVQLSGKEMAHGIVGSVIPTLYFHLETSGEKSERNVMKMNKVCRLHCCCECRQTA